MLKLTMRWVLICLILLLVVPVVMAEPSKIALYFKNADIKDVLRALADQAGVNLMIDTQVSGMITIHLSKVTFTEALNVICKNNGLTYDKENNVYHVSVPDTSVLRVEFQEGLLSVEAKETPLKKLLEEFGRKTGVNLVPAANLDERLSIMLSKVSPEDGLKAILSHANCLDETIGSVHFIRKKSTEQMSFTVIFKNNRLTVDARDIPVPVVARAIAEKTGISVIPDQNASQNISVFFQDLPLADGLAALCDANNLQLSNEGPVWRISNRSGSFRIKVKDGLLTVDADNTEAVTVFNEISRQSGVNIMVARDLRGQITAHFQNIPLAQGLTAISDTQGWIVEKQPKYYYIRPNSNQNQNIKLVYDPESRSIDLDVQSAPVTAILYEMARRADVNMVVLSQVNWTINNIRLRNVSFDQTIEFLLKGTIFSYIKTEDGTYLIGDGLIVRPENADFAIVKVYSIRYLKADQLLNTLPPIFPRQDFVQIQEKNALVVTAPQRIHDQFVNYLQQIDIETIEDRTDLIKVKYMKAEDVLKLIPQSIPKTDIMVVKEQNALAVTGPQNLLKQVRQYIEKIDQINPMIVFDVMVLLVSDTDGFTWSTSAGAITGVGNGNELSISPEDGAITLIKPYIPPTTTDNNDDTTDKTDKVLGLITSLVQKGKAKILANPTITTLNGYQASFNVTTKWSYNVTTQSISNTDGKTVTTEESVKTYDSGLYITILPWVSANNQITMEIKPKISEFGDSPANSTLPSTSERSTETTVRVANKQTTIISGLRTSRKQQSVSKIPLLGDIPLLGHLFKSVNNSDTQDEFVIIITPYLVYDEASKQEAKSKVLDHFGPEIKQQLESVSNPDTTVTITTPVENQEPAGPKETAPNQNPGDIPKPAPAPPSRPESEAKPAA
jgi:type II secretory pathway component GspD/PulD (secretin)